MQSHIPEMFQIDKWIANILFYFAHRTCYGDLFLKSLLLLCPLLNSRNLIYSNTFEIRQKCLRVPINRAVLSDATKGHALSATLCHQREAKFLSDVACTLAIPNHTFCTRAVSHLFNACSHSHCTIKSQYTKSQNILHI